MVSHNPSPEGRRLRKDKEMRLMDWGQLPDPIYPDPAAGCKSDSGCGDEDCHGCYPERCDICLAYVDEEVRYQRDTMHTRCFACQPVVCEDCGEQLGPNASTDKCGPCRAIIASQML